MGGKFDNWFFGTLAVVLTLCYGIMAWHVWKHPEKDYLICTRYGCVVMKGEAKH